MEQLLISERCRTKVETTDPIQGFLDLNVGPEEGPLRVFLVVLRPSRQVPEYCLKLGHSRFLPHNFQSKYRAILNSTIWAIENVVKQAPYSTHLNPRSSLFHYSERRPFLGYLFPINSLIAPSHISVFVPFDSRILPWKWRRQVPPKRWYICTRQQVAVSQTK